MSSSGRCCVKYCDGAGASPVELMATLHVLLCAEHAGAWRAEHASANVRTAQAHQRWRAWLEEAGKKAWALQSRQRQELEHVLVEQRARLRRQELGRFKAELQTSRRPSTRETLALASRALQRVAGALRSDSTDNTARRRGIQRLAAALAFRTPTPG